MITLLCTLFMGWRYYILVVLAKTAQRYGSAEYFPAIRFVIALRNVRKIMYFGILLKFEPLRRNLMLYK